MNRMGMHFGSQFIVVLSLHLLVVYQSLLGSAENLPSDGGAQYAGSEYYPYQEGYDHGYMSDWSRDRNVWSSMHSNQPKCVDIPSNLGLCHDIGYNRMKLPNLLRHDTMAEVLQQAATWKPLQQIRCHPDTQVFLCSLFSPVCLNQPIYPCRNLCEAVKEGCEGRMMHYGFPWPEILDCEQFPLDTDMCIGLQGVNKEGSLQCPACNQPNTFEAIVDNYCRAEIVIKMKIRREMIEGNEKKLKIGKKKKLYKKGLLKKRDLAGLTDLYINQSEKCDCELPDFDHKDDYYLAMGHRVGEKFYVNAVHLYDKKNVELRRGLRAIRKKSNICTKKGIEVLAVNDEPIINSNSNKKKKDRPRKAGNKKKEADAPAEGNNGRIVTGTVLDDASQGAHVQATTAVAFPSVSDSNVVPPSAVVENQENRPPAGQKKSNGGKKNKNKNRRGGRRRSRNRAQEEVDNA